MRKFLFVFSAATALSLTVAPSYSGSRYATPPATVLSGDLASPWILQLRNNQQYQKLMQRNAALRQQQLAQPKKHKSVRTATLIRPSTQAQTRVPAPVRAPNEGLDAKFLPQLVAYSGNHQPGTIVIDTNRRFLFLVEADGMARRYGVGVGKEGFEWSGTEKITRRAEWPDWRPPEEMRARERAKGRELPVVMAGGPENPLGARALYLGSTLYRIHGTNRPDTIGKAMSSGCIRMRNEDVTDLYERVKVGTKVVVL
jgi:lipoprotein-anchoring transpeptidase ErfK/SrfK